MNNIKEKILNCLKDVKGSGKFVTADTVPFLFPGLQIEGLGELSYPINDAQTKALISIAHKAPFGKGNETVLDNNVRSAWEINADKLTFHGKQWTTFLDKILGDIKPELGIEDYAISAHLYKMLIYEKGDFFLQHKDSEKEKGMFGTLTIVLPCRHTGGELVVSFDNKDEVVDFAKDSSDYKIAYAAFYADCDHEIKPVTAGYRICLVYNLVQKKAGEKIKPATVETHAVQLANIIKEQEQRGDIKPYIVLLGHQYTPENFSEQSLKLNDRHKADILFSAAQKLGFYAKMCLVTSYLSGAPAYSGSYDDDDTDEDAAMEEVYDESLDIEHWAESEIPALNDVSFDEEDLITSFAVKDDEPIVKEATGYMGNYGPDLMHWYHYAAVVIWSPAANAQLLPLQNAATQLQWIDYFNKNYPQVSNPETRAVELILSTGLNKSNSRENPGCNPIADWVINTKDETFFLRLPEHLCQSYFQDIDAGHWQKLIAFYPAETTEKIFELLTQNITLPVLAHLLSVVRSLLTVGQYTHFVTAQMAKLPQYLSEISKNQADKKPPINQNILSDVFDLEQEIPQNEAWVNNVAAIITGYNQRNYITNILTPAILALPVLTSV
ncbi:MAG TPA: 2OG-Fe(II) oxygenase, partial [Segetibacter sp.]|nr:2OG-Fe(II) oxygenase [Segetibacter sp.]